MPCAYALLLTGRVGAPLGLCCAVCPLTTAPHLACSCHDGQDQHPDPLLAEAGRSNGMPAACSVVSPACIGPHALTATRTHGSCCLSFLCGLWSSLRLLLRALHARQHLPLSPRYQRQYRQNHSRTHPSLVHLLCTQRNAAQLSESQKRPASPDVPGTSVKHMRTEA